MTCARSPPYIIWSRCELSVADNSLSEQTVTSGIQTQSIADMNAKYAIALILALQVSMSLCDIPEPEQELVDKYNNLKSTFYKRLLNAYGKVHEVAAPVIEKIGEGERGAAAKDLWEDLQSKPEVQAMVKVASALAREVGPLVDQGRAATLGMYAQYLRPHIGGYLDWCISNIKAHLDKFLPAEP
ncbi:apolipoprotein A-II [Phyllopteryx taeniolatus]|uniref:apolipoprotein A-II n=1 Tax=Phyllopteryx taeniolatus TaxID=161469 RepID=UPI002AD55B68|nr:apolipoprotein A-II [Phyllopteryx taeniolatus]